MRSTADILAEIALLEAYIASGEWKYPSWSESSGEGSTSGTRISLEQAKADLRDAHVELAQAKRGGKIRVRGLTPVH